MAVAAEDEIKYEDGDDGIMLSKILLLLTK
jgi:hypothetical protein